MKRHQFLGQRWWWVDTWRQPMGCIDSVFLGVLIEAILDAVEVGLELSEALGSRLQVLN